LQWLKKAFAAPFEPMGWFFLAFVVATSLGKPFL
jgi:hypothetical protein